MNTDKGKEMEFTERERMGMFEGLLADQALEREARELRDKVFGKPISDKEWATCREHWLADLEWLKAAADGRTPRREVEMKKTEKGTK